MICISFFSGNNVFYYRILIYFFIKFLVERFFSIFSEIVYIIESHRDFLVNSIIRVMNQIDKEVNSKYRIKA